MDSYLPALEEWYSIQRDKPLSLPLFLLVVETLVEGRTSPVMKGDTTMIFQYLQSKSCYLLRKILFTAAKNGIFLYNGDPEHSEPSLKGAVAGGHINLVQRLLNLGVKPSGTEFDHVVSESMIDFLIENKEIFPFGEEGAKFTDIVRGSHNDAAIYLQDSLTRHYGILTYEILIAAAKAGNMYLVQQLFMIRPREIIVQEEILPAACFSGNLKLVQWISDQYTLSDYTECYNRALLGGKLEVFNWLAARFTDPNSLDLEFRNVIVGGIWKLLRVFNM